MRLNIVCFSLVILSLFSCENKVKYDEGPLSAVVKLFSAEEVKDFDEAIKYIDINRVYAGCKEENKTPLECWKERVNFAYNLGKTEKFTNQFKYHEYRIVESVKGRTAKVEFTPLKKDTGAKTKVFELELRNSNWVVVKINHF